MGAVTDAFATAFRNFVIDGVPGSGANDVWKSEARGIGPIIEQMLGVGLGAVGVVKATKALLDADLAHAANTTALVYADSIDANNDLYFKVGASGTGGWTNTEALHTIMEGLAQPYVDAAEAAQVAAQNAAYRVSPMYPGITPHAAFNNLFSIDKIAPGFVPDGKIVYFKIFFWTGASFRGQMAYADDDAGTNEVVFADKLQTAALTGTPRITLRNVGDTADVVELRPNFGTGAAWSSNLNSGGTALNARIDLLKVGTSPLEGADQETRALAIVNRYYRAWANRTVTDRNLLGAVEDVWVGQGTPGRDYVIRYEKIFFPGIPLYRTRWFLYDPKLARDVCTWAYASATDPTATLNSLYRKGFLTDASLGSEVGPFWDAIEATFSFDDWTNTPWTTALTTTTDPAVSGVRRERIIDPQSAQDRFSVGSEPKQILTYGNAQADYVSLTALVVALRDPAIGSYTYSDHPTSFISFMHQVEAICVQAAYEEDLGDLVLPRWLTITGRWDTRLKGVTTRTFEQSFAGRIRRCCLRIEADLYLGHMDNTNGLSVISDDGVLRQFETHILEDCYIEVGAAQNVAVFGCGVDNNGLFAFRRCIVDVDPANVSAREIWLFHSNPGVTMPGRVEIEDCTVLKRNRTGPDILLQSLQTQAQPNVVSVRSSDLANITHEYGVGVSTPAWKRRGKLSVTTYPPVLDPS